MRISSRFSPDASTRRAGSIAHWRAARAACLDFGGVVSPQTLRMLCCDATAVPIVLNGKGQPLDVGRATRTVPDGLRRAVAARDRGCAHPGCGRPVSWSECHHVIPWPRTPDAAGNLPHGHGAPAWR